MIVTRYGKGQHSYCHGLSANDGRYGRIVSFNLHTHISQDMKQAIKATYVDNAEAEKKIDGGDFQLSVFEKRVLPRYWSSLVTPDMSVRIRLGLHDDDLESDKPSDVKSVEVEASDVKATKAKKETEIGTEKTENNASLAYRVDYYLKSRYASEPDKFLHSNYYDNPVSIEFKKGNLHKHYVLEEVRTITFGDMENIVLPKQGSKTMPKLGNKDVQGETKLHIHSAPLMNALRSVVKFSSSAPAQGDTDTFKEGIFAYPYAELFYYKEELIAYKKAMAGPRLLHTDDYNEECDHDIDLLVEYLYNEPSSQLAVFEAGLEQSIPKVTFAGFWLLVKPGSDVYVLEENQLNAYVVDSVNGGVDYALQSRWAVMPSSYSVNVWSLVYDGKVIRRKLKSIQVPVFDNEQDILSLPVFPTEFHDKLDGGARRKKLIERGMRFLRYSKGPAYMEYTGFGLKPGWKKVSSASKVSCLKVSLEFHTD